MGVGTWSVMIMPTEPGLALAAEALATRALTRAGNCHVRARAALRRQVWRGSDWAWALVFLWRADATLASLNRVLGIPPR